MADSYQKEKQLEASFLNNVTPNSTSIDTLASLKALQHFYKEDSDEAKAITSIAQEEARWTVAGIQALKSSRMLQEKLGTGFQASAIAGQLVKQRMAQNVYDAALKKAIESGGVSNLNLDKNARELLGAGSLINR